jgi:sec-independent protein translocase protein TatB
MFEVGFTEIILIFGIALLVLGPARLPKLAADLGRWAGRARTMARQLRTQLEQETQFDPLKDIRSAMDGSTNTIHPTPAPAGSQSSSAPDEAARSTPAQAADEMPPPMGESPISPEAPAGATDITPDAGASPADKTVADEPKHG